MSEDNWERHQEERRLASMRPVSHGMSKPQDTGPWAAVLAEVRRSAERVEVVEERVRREWERERRYDEQLRLAEATDAAVDGRGENLIALEREHREAAEELRKWLRESREERRHLSQASTQAIRAGLAERYVQSVRDEGRMIAGVLARALDAAGLEEDQRERAWAELRAGLADVTRELASRASASGLPQKSLES